MARETSSGHQLHLLVPGNLQTLTGGYVYDRRMVAALGERGWTVEVHGLDTSFPQPSTQALARAGRILSSLPDGSLVLVDGLAFGAMPELARAHRARLDLVALVHHPLAAEGGLGAARERAVREAERGALAAARLVVVTSPATARALRADYDVPAARIAVVEPGTDGASLARGSAGRAVHLVCVATVTPRKGHAVLVDALSRLPEHEWVLTCAGSEVRDRACARAVRARVEAAGLGERIVLRGEVSAAALDAIYDSADVFVLATRMEGFGMALAEALARGLPIVSTRVGAVPDTVPPDAGVLVEPDDPHALAAALERLVGDAAYRQRLARGARRARERLPAWTDSAARLAAALTGRDR